MGLPIKMNLDGNRLLNEDGVSNYTMNANFSSESNAIHNEYGFVELEKTKNLKIIGWKKIFGNQVILCSQAIGKDDYLCEIGILKGTDYSAIVRDNPAAGVFFNFDVNNLIQIEAKLTINSETIIYFVDGLNADKFLNITKPQVALDTFLRVLDQFEFRNMISFRLNSATNVYLVGTGAGGSLLSGVYYVLVTLWNRGGLKTHALIVSNPIPIIPADGYLDGAPAGTSTNQKMDMTLKIDEVDEGYDYYTVYAISKINQVVKAYEVLTSEIGVTDINFEISQLDAETEVSPDSIILNSSDYISALTLTQVDDVLFKGNLKSVDNFDFQPYVNNLTVRYTTKQFTLDTGGYGDDEGRLAFYSKGFMYDEVYALYLSFIIEDTGVTYETKAYHIPGRSKANLFYLQGKYENDRIDSLVTQLPYYTTTPDANTIDCPLNQILSIDPDAKIFQGLDCSMEPGHNLYDMGYWENEDEFYSSESKWLTVDRSGAPNGGDLRGQRVRHHKFPEAYSTVPGKPNMIVAANTFKTLGVKLEELIIPVEFEDKIKGFKLYYAKRDINNRTILGQALAIPEHQKHDSINTGTGILYPDSIYNSTGSFYVQDLYTYDPIDAPNHGFAPTNIKRAPFVGSIYNTGVAAINHGLPVENFCFKYRDGTPWPSNDGFITVHPFDTLSQSVRMNASHFKNVCRIKSEYINGSYTEGNSGISDPRGFVYTFWFYTVEAPYFFGIDRAEGTGADNFFYNHIRKIADVQLLENSNEEAPVGAYWRKYSEKRYAIAFHNRLRSGTTNYNGNTIGQDFGIVSLVDPKGTGGGPEYPPQGLYSGNIANGDHAFASPYLTNICSYKRNIFTSFDNQILCSTGFKYELHTSGKLVIGKTYQILKGYGDNFVSVGAANNNTGTMFTATGDTPASWTNGSVLMVAYDPTGGIYGGDSFISWYGERTTVDYDPIFRFPNPLDPPQTLFAEQFRTIHYYMCQSTSNIRLRHQGVNSNEIYFPKNAAELDRLGANFNNYYGYNIDYSSVNDLLQPTQELNRLDNDSNLFPNRIIKSQVNNPELIEDNYLIFNPGDVTDVGLQYGQIENLFNITNKLAIHLTNDLMLTMNKQQMDTSSGKAYIGAGDIFSVKPQDVNSNYYGGTIGRYAGTMTPYGYFFIDPLSYNIFNFDGNQLNVISSEGMERYFYKYLNFELPGILNNYNKKFIPEYSEFLTYFADKVVSYTNSYWIAVSDIPNGGSPGEFSPGVYGGWERYYLPSYNIRSSVGSLGYTVAYDTQYDRVIFSKIDYTFLKDEKGFSFEYTGIYDPTNSNQVESYITYDGQFGFYSDADGPIPLNWGYFTPVSFTEMYDQGLIDFNGFTVAYYPKIKSWVSFYSYIPEFLIGGSQNFFSSKNNTVFEHNLHSSPYFYEPDEIKWFIEPLYKMNGVEQLSSFSIKTDKIYFNQISQVPGPLGVYITQPNIAQSQTFDRYFAYNKNQMSFQKDFVNTDTSRDVEGYFRLNDFRDFTRVSNPVLFDWSSYTKDQRLDYLDANKHWSKLRKFTDFWQSARFTKDSSEFIDLGNLFLDGNNFLVVGSLFTVFPGAVFILSDGTNVTYATTDEYGGISDGNYKLRYLFNFPRFFAGNYNVKMYNGYNLSLLDTQANKKTSYR